MADRICSSDMTYSTSLMDTVTNTPTIHASTEITISTTPLYTATYTATAGGEAVNGCMIYKSDYGANGSITITHQEDSGAGFADTSATATIASNLMPDDGFVYFRFAVPFIYTTSTASKQRFKIVSDASSGKASADSGGSNIAFWATEDTTGVPANTDNIYVINQNRTGTATLTMDGTITLGSGTNTVLAYQRQAGNAITICNGGIIDHDTVADVTINCKGNIVIYNGGSQLTATSGTHLPDARTVKYIFVENGVPCNYGIYYQDGSITGNYGREIAIWTTELASGVGTAVSPLVTADAGDWLVGDKIVVYATSDNGTNYSESEIKRIITKNSSTSYVLADTVGGAESAFTYAHAAGATVVNVTRNIIFTTDNTTDSFYLRNGSLTEANIMNNWCEFNTVGYSGKSFAGGIYIGWTTNCVGNFDHCTVTNSLYQGFIFRSNNIEQTVEGPIVYNSANLTSASGSSIYNSAASGKTINDYHCVNVDRSALQCDGGNTIIFNDGRFNCVNKDGGSASAGLYLTGGTGIVWNDCEWNASRYPLSLGVAEMEFNDCSAGNKGSNNYDVYIYTGMYNISKFNNFISNDGLGLVGYENMAEGSLVSFDTFNEVTNNHIWYTPRGIGRSTGASLDDTTVRTAGTLNVRIEPEDATNGFIWKYDILARPGALVPATGFIYGNAAFVGSGDASAKVELSFNNFKTVVDSQTMTLTTDSASNDAAYSVSAVYTGTVNKYATVRITAKTTTSDAYAYVADIFNGTNNITNLLTWKDGQPSKIMFEQLGDSQATANAVWGIETSTLSTDGTTGKALADVEVETKNFLTQ